MYRKTNKPEVELKRLARALREAAGTVVLTGAGISTASGLEDYASPPLPGTPHPSQLLSASALYQQPQAFYRYCRDLFHRIKQARPNGGHGALARLEAEGFIRGVVTQNIDGLHQQAGSKQVLEIHGEARTVRCERCGQRREARDMLSQVEVGIIPPRCSCGGMLVPQVVLFGDPLPESFQEAREWVAQAELLLVAGSSLSVAPANTLPFKARRLALINRTGTPHECSAEIRLWEPLETALPQLLSCLGLSGAG